jgi:hypothetical protein
MISSEKNDNSPNMYDELDELIKNLYSIKNVTNREIVIDETKQVDKLKQTTDNVEIDNDLNLNNLENFLKNLFSIKSVPVVQDEQRNEQLVNQYELFEDAQLAEDENHLEQLTHDFAVIRDPKFDEMSKDDLIYTCQAAIRLVRRLESENHKLAISMEDIANNLFDLRNEYNKVAIENGQIKFLRYTLNMQNQELIEKNNEIAKLTEAKLIIENKLMDDDIEKNNSETVISELAGIIKRKNNIIKKLKRKLNTAKKEPIHQEEPELQFSYNPMFQPQQPQNQFQSQPQNQPQIRAQIHFDENAFNEQFNVQALLNAILQGNQF